jgi:hypothetical protein
VTSGRQGGRASIAEEAVQHRCALPTNLARCRRASQKIDSLEEAVQHRCALPTSLALTRSFYIAPII